jgi:hypothetical protein
MPIPTCRHRHHPFDQSGAGKQLAAQRRSIALIRFTAIPEPLEVTVDENAIVDWLLDARPGDRIVYFRGFLGLDRCKTGRIEDAARRRQLVAVANRIMAAAEQGLVMPVQKRIGEEDALYIAVRTLSAVRPRSRGHDATSSRGNQRTVAAGNEPSLTAAVPASRLHPVRAVAADNAREALS